MSKIRVLPENLANQIAAGEVVERPASVIKELVENSIDAGATKIAIETELGGRRLMKITDDGAGITRADSKLAFARHATSKLTSLDDLESIRTLGFRGEALASISSVAKTELITKTEDEEIATRVFTEDGKVFEISDVARPTGTTITVRDLFHNTPARRKFLRSQPTENYHIASIVTHYALANPEIAFTLTSNGRESIRVSPARTLRERAYQLFGNELIESLIPVSTGDGNFVQVEGFVSAPRERRTSRDAQYFFVNGRYIKDRVVSHGLSEGYRSVLPHGVYPVAFLFLELPPEEVDVNVHPSKTEVRFRRAEAIKEVIANAVQTALRGAGIGRQSIHAASEEQTSTHAESIEFAEPLSNPSQIEGEPDQLAFEMDKESSFKTSETVPVDFDLTPDIAVPDYLLVDTSNSTSDRAGDPKSGSSIPGSYAVLPPVDSAYAVPKSVEPSELNKNSISPIGQLHDSFIIAADSEGLLLIDQHVAHERILFDYFRKKESERSVESQNLLIPETIDLTPAQAAVFGEIEDDLEAYGFGVALLSGRTLAVTAIPTDLPQSDSRNLIAELLDTVETEKKGDANSTIKDDIAATLACKAAVKINMKLTDEKMRWMVDNLLFTNSPTTCPHGRPVILRLTMKDIERKFHRT